MLEFYSLAEPKARKKHICDLCGQSIDANEKYTRYSGKHDGDMFDCKYHTTCYNLIELYCESNDENEYDTDWIVDWLTSNVCYSCEKHQNDECNENIFNCDKVLKLCGKG